MHHMHTKTSTSSHLAPPRDPPTRLRIRLVAKRREQHEAEWCEAPDIVRLRGLVVRARKLRAYEREWGEVVVEGA